MLFKQNQYDMSGSRHENEAYSIIFYVAVLTLGFTLVFMGCEQYGNTYLLYTTKPFSIDDKQEILWIQISLLLSILITFILSVALFKRYVRGKDVNWRTYYWITGLLGLGYTFCIINSTGGISSSPFSALYPIFASTVITLFRRLDTRIFMIILIIIAIWLNYLFQEIWNKVPKIDNNTISYAVSYTVILTLLILLTIYIDSKSRKVR